MIAAAGDEQNPEQDDEDILKINDVIKALKLAGFKKWLTKNKSKTVRQLVGGASSMNIVEFFSAILQKSQEDA